MSWISTLPTVLASFLGSAVEFVEALTIVLAVGVVRGWRPASTGALCGLAALVLLVVFGFALNASLAQLPLPLLQTVVGVLLLMFGLRWLRKAILRGAGVLALHDEAIAFAEEVATMRGASVPGGGRTDAIAFLAAFKGVFLEGLEVVFIVIAIGANGKLLGPAVLGAFLALTVVVLLGLILHRPLTRVPENVLKFCVGALLSGFGTFWVGEGLGMPWIGGELALPVLIVVFGVTALLLVRVSAGLRSSGAKEKGRSPTVRTTQASPRRKGVLAGAVRELWGLWVDDGLLAVGIVGVVVVYAALQRGVQPADLTALAPSFTAMLLVVLCASAIRRAMAG
jgi:uncharacterized membrane protein